jgi:hypothetical protein
MGFQQYTNQRRRPVEGRVQNSLRPVQTKSLTIRNEQRPQHLLQSHEPSLVAPTEQIPYGTLCLYG